MSCVSDSQEEQPFGWPTRLATSCLARVRTPHTQTAPPLPSGECERRRSAGRPAQESWPDRSLSWTPEADGRPSLWLFRPDGRRRLRITEDPHWFDVHPAFSPDGRRIAFVRTGPWAAAAPSGCAVPTAPAPAVGRGASGGERFVSPVWLSDTQLSTSATRRSTANPTWSFGSWTPTREARPRVAASATSFPAKLRWSPMFARPPLLLVSAQRGVLWATADIYLWDRQGRSIGRCGRIPAGTTRTPGRCGRRREALSRGTTISRRAARPR